MSIAHLFCFVPHLLHRCGFIIVQNDEILDLARLYKKLRISLIRSLAASASNSYCDIAGHSLGDFNQQFHFV